MAASENENHKTPTCRDEMVVPTHPFESQYCLFFWLNDLKDTKQKTTKQKQASTKPDVQASLRAIKTGGGGSANESSAKMRIIDLLDTDPIMHQEKLWTSTSKGSHSASGCWVSAMDEKEITGGLDSAFLSLLFSSSSAHPFVRIVMPLRSTMPDIRAKPPAT